MYVRVCEEECVRAHTFFFGANCGEVILDHLFLPENNNGVRVVGLRVRVLTCEQPAAFPCLVVLFRLLFRLMFFLFRERLSVGP